MSSIAEYNFADWYRPADSQLTAQTQTARIDAIKVLLKKEEPAFWLDVVRLYASIAAKNPSNHEAFIKAFKDEDTIFPVTGNIHLIKVLAGILLCFKLEEISHLNNFIALAIRNINFFGQYDFSGIVPVLSLARNYLIKESTEVREVATHVYEEDLVMLDEEKEDETYTYVKSDHDTIVNTVYQLVNAQKVYSEESNILWWLFGESSVLFDMSLKTIGLPKAIPVVSRELFDLLEFPVGTQKIDSILKRALQIASGNKVIKDSSVNEIIEKFEIDEIKVFLNNVGVEHEFTPVLSAMQKYISMDKATTWADAYSTDFNAGNVKKTYPASQIASQLLHEFLLIKNLK
jgi:hypothetical protein